MKETNIMPSKGLHLTLLIISFAAGALWGALSISPYTKMKTAITTGDSTAAWACAKKVKIFFWIGLAVNAVLFLAVLI